MIGLECLCDGPVHITELTAVALIEDDNNVLAENRVSLILPHEDVQFLDGGDDDMYVRITHLPLEHGGAGVAIGRALLEAVVLLHGLIIQIFSVHHEQHLVDVGQAGGQLRRFEGGQRLAAAGGVPDVAAGLDGATFL